MPLLDRSKHAECVLAASIMLRSKKLWQPLSTARTAGTLEDIGRSHRRDTTEVASRVPVRPFGIDSAQSEQSRRKEVIRRGEVYYQADNWPIKRLAPQAAGPHPVNKQPLSAAITGIFRPPLVCPGLAVKVTRSADSCLPSVAASWEQLLRTS